MQPRGFVENVGPNTLERLLAGIPRRPAEIFVGAAFITSAGLSRLLYVFRSATGRVRVLTGLYDWVTEPSALKTLLHEQAARPGHFEVRLSTNRRFHWKCYSVTGASSVLAVIGSSNLTTAGISAAGELNAVLALPRRGREALSLGSIIDSEWRRSKLLNGRILTRYEKARSKAGASHKRPRVPLRDILGADTAPPAVARSHRYFRDGIVGIVSDATSAALREYTDWDRRNLYWYATQERDQRPGDLIVLFDLLERQVRLLEVLETTRTPIRTPDGRDFIACRKAKRSHGRKLKRDTWAKLREGGVVKGRDDAAIIRKLSPEAFRAVCELLRLT